MGNRSLAGRLILGASLMGCLCRAQTHQSGENTKSDSSPKTLSATEKVKKEVARKDLEDFSIRFMNDLGCSNFESAAFEQLLKFVRSSNQVSLSRGETFNALAANLFINNRVNLSPQTLATGSRDFTLLMRRLSELVRTQLPDLYRKYNLGTASRPKPPSPNELASILRSADSRQDSFKMEAQIIFRKLGKLSGKIGLDIGCHDEAEKNFVMVKSTQGPLSISSYLKKLSSSKIALIPRSAPISAPSKQAVPEFVPPSHRQVPYKAAANNVSDFVPDPPPLPVPTFVPAVPQNLDYPVKPATSQYEVQLPAFQPELRVEPNVVKREDAPVETNPETIVDALPEPEEASTTPPPTLHTSDEESTTPPKAPLTYGSKKLLSDFKEYLQDRGIKNPAGFYEKIKENLKPFEKYLLHNNPLGALCGNFLSKSKTDEDRRRILAKTVLVHWLSENGVSDHEEDFAGENHDSVGGWQTSLDTKAFGCKFRSKSDIRNNIDMNLDCIFRLYTFRQRNFGTIYGRTSNTASDSAYPRLGGQATSGLHWSVLMQAKQTELAALDRGSKKAPRSAFFEIKFEPLFRNAVPECRNDFDDHYQNPSAKADSPVTGGAFIQNALGS